MSGFLAIMDTSEEDFNKLATAIDTADGAATSMAETMNDNLKGQLTLLGSALEGVGIKIYDKFEQPMKKAAKSAIDSMGKLSKSLSNGKLSKSVDKLAESMGSFMSKAADLAAKALPSLINGMAFFN